MENNRKPLIIYLDTQDYIAIFNDHDNGKPHDVLNELIQAKERGEIVIGYSFVNVFEFITKPNLIHRQERIRRGELIKHICGRNAFPYITEMREGASFPNNGRWMAAPEIFNNFASKLRQKAVYELKKQVLESVTLNRSQKRSILSDLKRKDFFIKYIKSSNFSWGTKREHWGDFPVSEEVIDSGIVSRLLLGQCSDSEFEKVISNWIYDPAEFSRIFYDYMDKPNLINHIFGESIEKFQRSIIELQESTKRLQEANQQLQQTKKRVRQFNARVGAQIRSINFKTQVPSFAAVAEKVGVVVGRERAGHFAHYAQVASKPNYNFKASDIMDLMQFCYAYDVDLFRCDKAMAHIFRDYEPFRGKLVSSFFQLPEKIQEIFRSIRIESAGPGP